MSEDQKIVVDIGAAMEVLQSSPEIAEEMSRMILGAMAPQIERLERIEPQPARCIAAGRKARTRMPAYSGNGMR